MTNFPDETERKTFKGHDARSLGPSNSSDSGSDLDGLGLGDEESTDAEGTGERITAGEDPSVRIASDIGVDRIVDADEAGLGGGMDQAEEARAGITDEELAKRNRPRK